MSRRKGARGFLSSGSSLRRVADEMFAGPQRSRSRGARDAVVRHKLRITSAPPLRVIGRDDADRPSIPRSGEIGKNRKREATSSGVGARQVYILVGAHRRVGNDRTRTACRPARRPPADRRDRDRVVPDRAPRQPGRGAASGPPDPPGTPADHRGLCRRLIFGSTASAAVSPPSRSLLGVVKLLGTDART